MSAIELDRTAYHIETDINNLAAQNRARIGWRVIAAVSAAIFLTFIVVATHIPAALVSTGIVVLIGTLSAAIMLVNFIFVIINERKHTSGRTNYRITNIIKFTAHLLELTANPENFNASNRVNFIKRILKSGISPNVYDENLISPLYNAIDNADVGVIKILLEYGAKLDNKSMELLRTKCAQSSYSETLNLIRSKWPDLNLYETV